MAEFDEDINLEESEGFLEGNWGKGLGLLGSAYAAPGMVKYTRAQELQGIVGARMNNIIDQFYSPGADKLGLLKQHVQHSENLDAISFLRNAKKNDSYRFLLDQVNYGLKGSDKLGTVLIDDTTKRTYQRDIMGRNLRSLKGWRSYKSIDPLAHSEIAKLKKGLYQGNIKNPYTGGTIKSIGELNALAELDTAEQLKGQGQFVKGKKPLTVMRHEVAKNELVRHVHNTKFDLDNLVSSGYGTSKDMNFNKQGQAVKLKTTNAGNFFRGVNKDVMSKWGLVDGDKITFTGINNAGDKWNLSRATRKDLSYQLQEYVTKYANLNSKKSILETAEQGMESLLHGGRRYLHPDESPQAILDSFKNNHKVRTVNGNKSLIFNFSPARKPNYLLGGVNANSVTYLDNRGQVKYNILHTDLYDVTGSDLQRGRHINYYQTHNIGTTKKGVKIADFNPVSGLMEQTSK